MARTAKKKIAIKDLGVTIADDADSLNFTGAGHTGSASGQNVTEDFPNSGGGTAAGATGDIQINTAGAFDADSGNFWYDKVAHQLNVTSGTLGSEMIVNGTFTGSATPWTINSPWSYSSNAIVKSIDGTTNFNNANKYQVTPVVGLTYQFSYVVSGLTVGSLVPSFGGKTFPTITSNGTYTYRFTCLDLSSSNAFVIFTPSNTARMIVDTVSLKKVLGGSAYFGNSVTTQVFNSFIENLQDASGDGVFLRNPSAATNSTVQASPATHYQGSMWESTGSGSSFTSDFRTFLLPVSSASTSRGLLTTQYSAASGAAGTWGTLQTLSETGQFTNYGNLTISANNFSTAPSDTDSHQTFLSPSGSVITVGYKFGSTYKSSMFFDSGGTIAFQSANGNFNFYDAATGGALQNQIFNGGYYSNGGGFFNGSVAAGSNTISPSSRLTAYGRTGIKTQVITTTTTLGNSHGTVLTDATNSHSCSGSPTYACSHWLSSVDCTTNESHGGCIWTGSISCSAFNGNQTSCQATSGCTYDSASCSAFNNDSSACTAQSPCAYPGNLGACSAFTSVGACTPAGCTWTEDSINCSVFNGNYSACIAQSPCTSGGNSCPSFTNDTDCTNGGCTPVDGNACSVFNADIVSCVATAGCSVVDGGNCNDFNDGGFDGTACAAAPGGTCSYDIVSGTCSGVYFSACSGSYFSSCSGDNSTCSGMYDPGTGVCSGTYDDGSCTGTYYTGNCSGVYGLCSGSSHCGTITASGDCAAEAGCSYITQLSITLDPETTSPFVFYAKHRVKDVSTAGTTVIYPNTGQSIYYNASNTNLSSFTITNKSADFEYFAYPGNCATDFGDQTSCEATPGCSDVFGNCSAYSDGGGDGTACLAAPFSCSYDSSSGACTGSPWVSCSGTYAASKKWYITSLM